MCHQSGWETISGGRLDEASLRLQLSYLRERVHANLPARLTCVTVTRDSRYILVNLSSGEIHLLDIENGEPIRTFKGQEQGNYIIRSCFGGAAENFVLSGSEGTFRGHYQEKSLHTDDI